MSKERTFDIKHCYETDVKIKFSIDSGWTARDELEAITPILKETLIDYKLPCTLEMAELKAGGLFNATKIPCIVVTNREHPYDYLKLLITVVKQGSVALVEVYETGTSKELKKLQIEEQKRRAGKLIIMNKHNAHALKEEQGYYALVVRALSEAYRAS